MINLKGHGLIAPILIIALLLAAQESMANSSECGLRFSNLASEQIIPLNRVSSWKKMPTSVGGDNHLALYEGQLNGQIIFVKVSFAKKAEGAAFKSLQKEAEWVERLDRLEIGPRFFGLVESPDGLGIAAEYVRGASISSVKQLENASVTAKTLSDLRRVKKIFSEEGIHPMDFQFLLEKDGGVKVIDPAAFLLEGRDVPKNFRKGKANILDSFIEAAEKKIGK